MANRERANGEVHARARHAQFRESRLRARVSYAAGMFESDGSNRRVAALGLLLLMVLAATAASRGCAQQSRARSRGIAATRVPVTSDPFVAIPYPPPPTQRPMVTATGLVRYGYSSQAPDRVALRATLFARRFAQLNEWMESYQRDAAADPTRELWPVAAVMAFRSNDVRLRALLDEWSAAHPRSWAPFAARAAHLVDVAEYARGDDVISEVPAAKLAVMNIAFDAAEAAIERALEIEPRLLPMYTLQLSIQRHRASPAARRAVYDRARAIFPRSFELPWVYSASLEPRWGGSEQEIAQFARGPWDVAGNPRLALLYSLPERYACAEAARTRAPDAEQRCSAVLVDADDDNAYEDRARVRSLDRARLGDAIADYRASLAVRPQVTRVLARLAGDLADSGRIEEGAERMIELFLLDPVGMQRVRQHAWWQRTLATQQQRALAQHDTAQAARFAALLDRLRFGQ